MWLDLFRDKARTKVDGKSIFVTFTHWSRRAQSFSFDIDQVKSIEAVQIEPFVMQLVFLLRDHARRTISEEMLGWREVLSFVERSFAGFDRDGYEHAKGQIDQPFLCWHSQREDAKSESK
jgi:hypothetical protein